ncbi:MAG: glycosyltransferase [Candidatus Parvarchaeota archaeon]|nr:glycosyltransferase [Candidatus Parvarchaeota archaeon]
MKKLRIAIYTDIYLPKEHNGGGLETYIDSIRQELRRRGHTVFIVTSGPKILREYYKDDKEIIVLPGRRIYRPYPYFGLYTGIFKADPKLVKMKPDVIHIQTPFTIGLLALKVGKNLGINCIATYHGFYTSDMAIESFISRKRLIIKSVQLLAARYIRWFHSKVKVVISPSNFIKKELNRMGLKNVIVVHEGIDLARFKKGTSKSKARKLLGIGQRDKVMLHLGRVSLEKNLDLFIKAAKELERYGVKSIIVGAGKDLEHYKKLSRELGIKSIKFAGFVDEDKKVLYYKAADVFCFPSNFETQGLVAVEAMASGLPVVAPEGTAQAEMIKPGLNGEVFKKDDLKDLLRKIRKVLSNGSSYAAERSIEDFDIKRHVSKLLKIYMS